jgi:hypothetical protein
MRFALRLAVLGGACFLSAPASADTRTFIIDNTPDGYGVDHCLATGERCGVIIANAFCQAREYQRAASFRKVDAVDVTSAIRVAAEMPRDSAALVAIECAR